MKLQCEAPVRYLSWGSHNSNFTMVYGRQITTVSTGANNSTNVHITFGGPHIVEYVTILYHIGIILYIDGITLINGH